MIEVNTQITKQLEKIGFHPGLARNFKTLYEGDFSVGGRIDILGNIYYLFCYFKKEGSIGELLLAYSSQTNKFLFTLIHKYDKTK